LVLHSPHRNRSRMKPESIFFIKNNRENGPFTKDQIETMMDSGMISGNDIAWHPGSPKKTTLEQLLAPAKKLEYESILVIKNNKQTGPFTYDQIKTMIASGMISKNDIAWHPGSAQWEPLIEILKPTSNSIQHEDEKSQESWFFHMPKWDLFTLISITSGFFINYWMYNNWSYLKNRDNLNISPFWRGVFCIFYVESLFKKIRNDKQLNSTSCPNFSHHSYAASYIIFTLIPFAGILNTLIIFDIQQFINNSNKNRPADIPYSPWSDGQTATVIIGIPFLLLYILMFLNFFTT
jgi:hypothetical protein